jgi:RNA polymerase sigma-70 factor (ECF subfamily)
MTETSWVALRDLLVDRYDELRDRLARRLRSADLASDILQETWLRLARGGSAGVLRSPEAYLFRMALNVAANERDSQKRRLDYSEVDPLMKLDKDEIDPERVAAARSEISALAQALDELPPRRRAIFIMARVDELPHREIGERTGLSVRMVDRELRKALEHCGQRLDRKVVRVFGPKQSDQPS